MMIRMSATMMFAGGALLWMTTKGIPFLSEILLDYVAVFMMAGGMFILLFCFGLSQTGMQYDTIPAGSAIINYIRRDGIIIPLLGKRVFPGESFLDVPKLGIIEDLGKDTVFLWGRKKVRFGIENINYTPDPRYCNMCSELYRLGFDDLDDLQNILNIPYIDSEREKPRKVYYLERMAHIYWNMTHQQPRGAEHLISVFKKRRDKNIVFGTARRKKQTTVETTAPPREQPPEKQVEKKTYTPDIHDEIDKRLKKW